MNFTDENQNIQLSLFKCKAGRFQTWFSKFLDVLIVFVISQWQFEIKKSTSLGEIFQFSILQFYPSFCFLITCLNSWKVWRGKGKNETLFYWAFIFICLECIQLANIQKRPSKLSSRSSKCLNLNGVIKLLWGLPQQDGLWDLRESLFFLHCS